MKRSKWRVAAGGEGAYSVGDREEGHMLWWRSGGGSMGKVASVLAVVALLAAATVAPWRSVATTRAQTSPVSCSNQPLASPMQGHYAGVWHSEGDYHFHAHFDANAGFPAQDRDIEMKLSVDGKLDLTVSSGGQVSGTATGSVNAPIFHEGKQDISSGIGTISGQVTGVFSSGGSILVLSHPVIDMQWGTFGGRQVETHPVMSDFQLSVSGFDCVSSQGVLAEQGFPVMNITDDSTGQLTQAPGIGGSSGTWQIASDKAAAFRDLSQQVDSFLSQASALLDDSSVVITPALIDQRIVQPLQSLENTIRQDPDVSRCLLERIGRWEAAVVPELFRRVVARSGASDLPTLRRAGDLFRSATALNLDCGLSDNGAGAALLSDERGLLDRAIAARDWSETTLLVREIVLFQGDGVRGSLQQEINRDVHVLVGRLLRAMVYGEGTHEGLPLQRIPGAARRPAEGAGPTGWMVAQGVPGATAAAGLLDVARVAFALKDDGDAAAAVARLSSSTAGRQLAGKKKRRKRPRSTPTPTPTPAPKKTIRQVLLAGVVRIRVNKPAGSPPVFSWAAVSGATRYLVVVNALKAPPLLWTWSGNAGSVTYGDTVIEGAAGTNNDGWPVSLNGADYRWTVLALNAQGQIVGIKFRANP